jgi:deoxyadenosine/deoxycytidine kinase
MGLMASRDFDNYMSLFDLVNSFVQPPDLLIYLKASTSTLVNQIQKRGRKYESSIRLDYLQSLNDRYETWANSYNQGKILVIDVDSCKFSDNKEDLGMVIDQVNAELFGLFPKDN